MRSQTCFRVAATLLLFVAAILLAHALWNRYMYAPWTRDGRVRAKVVNIAPDVSGIVTDVLVADNQAVRRGDVLFRIDPERFRYALAQADAQVELRKAELDMRRQQASRRALLDSAVVSAEVREDAGSAAKQALANYQAARAARDVARLNLARSEVRAPVDGYITNLNLYAGDYASAGVARLALIDAHSYWVYGYFEETKLPQVRVGDPAEIRLLGDGPPLTGHVESIARGISDRDNPAGATLLADVNPVFTWVRLAQRVPVRIRLDDVPAAQFLAAGTTCTVTLRPAPPERGPGRRIDAR
ncbi:MULTISPECIES: efflux RND transporter periplasmic adaptor subunit [Burkholderia]|uniref:efflux RND transporter periplasmic adaptor subunit n=1 Tax=Burkholderia TaxID=32008 RepID=UPI00080B78C1|nr:MULTISPECIES: HlyD family secretion protein [Burkholderia]MCA8480325.1 HlyD family secretion protein [Burkholderia multivorans]MDR9051620.1 p-hydroxybenzoic acid efflux pump subunit AaeA [Burkholderia multivorans]MDR9057842.1 p-hydroxybenzoic acid efflux pump subunit AaeA [Burkholderia multivorans]MDR9066132.1 p-hydroxybenzoic acid efflux pump subunit AaeA [Burkholderia multivorans]MDR9069637.1 p-hydroxybenzoic acid efflux pump subunit AaeA [Burkholderia multivorans]